MESKYTPSEFLDDLLDMEWKDAEKNGGMTFMGKTIKGVTKQLHQFKMVLAEKESEKLVMVHSTVRSKGDNPMATTLFFDKKRQNVVRGNKRKYASWQDRFGSMVEQHQQLK